MLLLAACTPLFRAGICQVHSAAVGAAPFVAGPILSRPTDSSVTITLLPSDSVEVFSEYGTDAAEYPYATEAVLGSAGTPLRLVMRPLAPDTRYDYRVRYRKPFAGQFLALEEHTFTTRRSREQTFRFTVEADPHLYDKKGSHTLWPITLQNQLADSADFVIDLGDTFGDDHNPTTITSEEIRQLHLDPLPYFGLLCHSSPLFLCLGNHEGESGYYLLQAPPNNLAVYGTLWRKFCYANPIPDRFFSGNTTAEEYGIGLPENYYSWEWGDALFIVLDAYRGYTASAKPRGWDWTLGKTQYDWLKQTLEESRARYKFVFAHHTLGETRGGIATAPLYEWGGYEADGTTWGFQANRPGWAVPIHQLMVQNGVTIYFQGHDHLFATEQLDGLVYQEVPMPSDSTYIIGVRDNGSAYTGITVDGSGHLRVTVEPESVNVEYVRAYLPSDEDANRQNRQVAYRYAVRSAVTSAGEEVPLPETVTLEQNYPNPFNPTTVIRYRLPAAGPVTLAVYDLLGREAALLVHEFQQAGEHEARWDGSGFSSGIYLCRLTAGGHGATKTMSLLR